MMIEEKLKQALENGNVDVNKLIEEILKEDLYALGFPVSPNARRRYDYFGEIFEVIIRDDYLLINNKKFPRN